MPMAITSSHGVKIRCTTKPIVARATMAIRNRAISKGIVIGLRVIVELVV
jgi:hypothetical protein